MQKYGKFLNWQRNREYFFKKNFLLDVLPVQVGNLRGYIERIGLFVEFLTLDIAVRAITIIVQQNKSAYWKQFSS